MINNSGSDREWSTSAPRLGDPPDWSPVWSSEGSISLHIEAATIAGRPWHRIRTGERIGAGAVAVAFHRSADNVHILLVRQQRPAPGVMLWELPRGMADPDDRDLVRTGLRELAEETGVRATAGTLLGTIHPDSGLMASAVGVILVELDSMAEPRPADGEVDQVAWFDQDQVTELIASAQLRDGISLAALMLAQTWSRAPGTAD